MVELEGAEGVELREAGLGVKLGAADPRCGAGVGDADGFEGVGGCDGGGELVLDVGDNIGVGEG